MSFEVALIPAAGRGARLDRPETPKPLVHVGGEPLLVRLLRQFETVGVKRAVVVLGYDGKKIARELDHHPTLGIEVTFVENPEWESGLASSILAAKDGIREPFLLAMADHVFEPELVREMSTVELGKDAVAMLVDASTPDASTVSSAMKVTRNGDRLLRNGRTLEAFDAIDAGLFAASPDLFDALAAAIAGKDTELNGAINVLAGAGRARVVETAGRYWFDVDTPHTLIRAEMKLRGLKRGASADAHGPAAKVDTAPANYTFTIGAPTSTKIYVERGFVRDPKKLAFIPKESASSPLFVFTDTRVDKLYADDFVGGLEAQGYLVHRIVMSEGEDSKTLANYARLVEEVLARGIDERSILISLGGGAVCNVCGFLASTLYRGIGLIHVPTTLMAQCDAAISHKQGVNGARGKNMVGAYYAPIAICVDVEVLSTLEDWLIPDGLAEVVKHALGQDSAYLDYLLAYEGDMRDLDFLETVVRKNIELKCKLMATDPHEHHEAMVLQYGHTCGHPIEYLSGYSLSHGQAVAVGMMVAAHVARLLGGSAPDMVDVHRRVISRYKLPIAIPDDIADDEIIDMLKYNKRYLTEGTRMALIDGPGHLWSVAHDFAIPVGEDVLRRALTETRKESKAFMHRRTKA